MWPWWWLAIWLGLLIHGLVPVSVRVLLISSSAAPTLGKHCVGSPGCSTEQPTLGSSLVNTHHPAGGRQSKY